MHKNRGGHIGAASALAAAILISGCGGGGGSAAQTQATVTAAADSAVLSWNSPATIDVLANDAASSGAVELDEVSTPGHGSASIVDGQVVYTPEAGYFGSDSLTYTVRATNGGATSSAIVALTVEARLRLSGIASDSALASAQIIATVGNAEATSTTDAGGNYDVDIESSNPGDMVTITAVGAPGSTHVKLVSLAGDLATLASQADVQGTVDSRQAPSLNVSHLSTALAALLVEANGGMPPSTLTQLDTLTKTLSLEQMVDLATAIKLVAHENVALPEGVEDTFDLVSGPSTSDALAGFLQVEASSARFADVRSAALSSSMAAAAPPIAETGQQTLVYYRGYGLPGDALMVTYEPDGAATVARPDGSRAATWEIVNDTLVLMLAQPFSEPIFDVFDPDAGEWYPVLDVITGYELRLVSGSVTTGVAFQARLGTRTFQEGPKQGMPMPLDSSIAYPSKVLDLSLTLAFADEDLAVGSRWAGLPTDSGLDFQDMIPDTLEIMSPVVATFDRTEGSRSWAVEDGWLALTDGTTQWRLARLTPGTPTGEEHWIATIVANGAVVRAAELMVFKSAKGLAFANDARFHRRWESAGIESGVYNGELFIDVFADGTGAQVSDTPLTATSSAPTTWAIDASGRMSHTRSSISRREWTLLKSAEWGIVVMENLVVPDADFDMWRVNVYLDRGPS